MFTRRHMFAAAMAGLSLIASVSAYAMDAKPFDKAAFEAARASGKAVLVGVSAPWCSVCKVQKPILSELTSKHPFENFAFFEVDFDTRKDALKALNVHQQSTLVVFKGQSEKGRSTGETNAAAIEALLRRAL